MAGVLLTGTAAVAATAGGEGGTVLPKGAPTGDGEHADETIVAAGATPVAGPWRMTTYTSSESRIDDGDLSQPGGVPCLRLTLTTAVTPLSGSGWCGETDREFIVSGLPVTTVDGRAEVILFGVAPEAATSVQLVSADGKVVAAHPSQARGRTPGRPWVMAAPLALTGAQVVWLDERGDRHSARDVSREFDRAAAQRLAVERSDLSAIGSSAP